MRWWIGFLRAALAGACMMCGARAQEIDPAAPEPLPAIAYGTVIRGLDGEADALAGERIRAASDLLRREAQGAPSIGALERRMEADLAIMARILRSEAFYLADVAGTVQETPGGPATATITITPGPRFRLGSLRARYGAPPPREPEIPPRTSPWATGPAIVGAEAELLNAIRADGHLDATVLERRAVLDRGEMDVDVTWFIEAGPVVQAESITVEGAADVDAGRIEAVAGIAIGDILSPQATDKARDRLLATGMFESASVEPAGSASGALRPVRIRVQEALPRTVGGGVRWASDEGFGLRAYWTHRNLFGGLEWLSTELVLAERLSTATADYRIPAWRRPDQALIASALASSENSEAYDEDRFILTAGLERELSEELLGRASLSLEGSIAEEDGQSREALLLGLPIDIEWDGRDDALNPTRGERAVLRLGPYAGVSDGPLTLFVTEGVGSTYWALDEEARTVIAARARLGVTFGPAGQSLPPSRRFFAGGGGSIRGYAFQSAGPRDANREPTGGKSVVELGLEWRQRLWGDFGGVAFVDAGGAYTEAIPDFGTLLVGAGLGVRYYSPIGPVRLDVAVPLNKREGDDAYQIYVSIGQAF